MQIILYYTLLSWFLYRIFWESCEPITRQSWCIRQKLILVSFSYHLHFQNKAFKYCKISRFILHFYVIIIPSYNSHIPWLIRSRCLTCPRAYVRHNPHVSRTRACMRNRQWQRSMSHSRAGHGSLSPASRLFSSILARVPTALYAVVASAGPVGGRVGTRPRPDSAYAAKPTIRFFGTCRRMPSRRTAPYRTAPRYIVSRRAATFRVLRRRRSDHACSKFPSDRESALRSVGWRLQNRGCLREREWYLVKNFISVQSKVDVSEWITKTRNTFKRKRFKNKERGRDLIKFDALGSDELDMKVFIVTSKRKIMCSGS